MSKNTEHKKLVPGLRFSEFEVNGEWKNTKLKDLATLTSSKRVHLADYVERGIPFFRGKEISELKRGIIPSDILFISEEQYEQIKNKYGVPMIGDLLITAVGTLGNVYRIATDAKFYFKDGNLIWFQNISINSLFLEILLEVKHKEVLATAIGSSQKALTMKALNKLPLSIPDDPKEQQKIAATLTTLDHLIAAETEKRDALQAHKKGLLQQLFPAQGEKVPKLWFGEFRGEWEEKKLSSIAENLSNRRIPITSSKREKGEIPYYGATGVIDYVKDFIFDDDLLLISEDGANLIDRNYPIAFSISGKTWVNNHAHVLKFHNKSIETLVQKFINSRSIEDYLTGQAQPKLNRKNLDRIPIPLPKAPKEEQKIANCLSSLDDLITAQSEKIEALKEHKKGLMQQMFPKNND